MELENYQEDAVRQLHKLKDLADKAVNQIADAQLFEVLDKESNSIAIIMKHMAGNMRSRWSNFLTSDGEKPDRFRDKEFVIEEEETKDSILGLWLAGSAFLRRYRRFRRRTSTRQSESVARPTRWLRRSIASLRTTLTMWDE